MNIEKLGSLIAKLEPEYYYLMDEVASGFLQEIIDFELFNNGGIREVSCEVVLNEIGNELNENIAIDAQDCAVEFCLTNEYLLEKQRSWNCINHILEHHSNLLTSNNKKYLKALNNSYLGIYKVVSIEANTSITLEDMIEPNKKSFKILDKNLRKTIRKDQIIATRIIEIEHKTKPSEYKFSNSLIVLPQIVATQTINNIQIMLDAMKQPLLMQAIVPKEERFEDSPHNRLMLKKMWAKEILEQWYSYYANYDDYHEFFDYEGNPLQPCSIEFDVVTSPKKISEIFNALPDFIESSVNSWVWVDNAEFVGLNFIKDQNPSLRDSSKSPLYYGAVMQNKYNKSSHRVLADIRLKKDKLIIEVGSVQRANIAQDFITTKCSELVKKPVIIKKSDNNPKILPSWNNRKIFLQ